MIDYKTVFRIIPKLTEICSSGRCIANNTAWLKESVNLLTWKIIAADITVDLEVAMAQFATIAEDLKK